MAISATYYVLVRDMFQSGIIKSGGPLLELGEANWYDQISLDKMIEDCLSIVPAEHDPKMLRDRLTHIKDHPSELDTWGIAKIFYGMFFNPSRIVSIDYHGTEKAHRIDLNKEIMVPMNQAGLQGLYKDGFSYVFNHGTAEHVFNIGQVFKTMHDWTAPGGLMFHEGPFTGWIEHGFYALQPGLFFDVARANRYEIMGIFIQDLTNKAITQIKGREHTMQLTALGALPASSQLFCVMKKTDREPFVTPMQAIYTDQCSDSMRQAWRAMR